MPLTSGPITRGGAVTDVLVGGSPARAGVLRRCPVPVAVRAQIDTGASDSAFSGRVFAALDLTPVTTRQMSTPSTPVGPPFVTDVFDVTVYLVANGRPYPVLSTQVMAARGGTRRRTSRSRG